MIERSALLALIEAELAAVADPAAREAMRGVMLADPIAMRCAWDYGAADETFPCWRVAAREDCGVGVVYCELGFGPKCPWGLVWLNEAVPRMGMDSGWFCALREALADLLDEPEWAA